ncbi:hypothetical protein [Streptomyces sp. NPDC054834]
MAGLLPTAAGTLPFIIGTGTGTGYGFVLSRALVVRGFGMSAADLAVMAGAFQCLDRARIPDAGTTTRIVQQLAGVFGTAVLAVGVALPLPARRPMPAAAQVAGRT